MTFDSFKEEVARRAKEAGAEAFELYSVRNKTMEVAAHEGEVDTFSSDQDFAVNLRLLAGGRMGYATTQVLSPEEASWLVESALDSARATQNADIDEICAPAEGFAARSGGLSEPEALYSQLQRQVLTAERACLAADSRITSVSDAQAAWGGGTRAIYNSRGLDLSDETCYAVGVIGPTAKEGGRSYNEYEVASAPDPSALSLQSAAQKAVEATLSFIGSEPADTGRYAVALAPAVACDLLGTFSGVFSGLAAVKGLSLLKGREGEAVAAPCLTLRDDPFCMEAILHRRFDDQGVPTFGKNLIEKGVLKTLLHNRKTAALLGAKTTANAYKSGASAPLGVTPTNLYFTPSERSRAQLLKEMGEGVFITNVKGLHAGANPTTGDFSLEAKGYLVAGGQLGRPVSGITVAGNFYQLLKDVRGLADDLAFDAPGGAGQIGSPTVWVDGLSVSGR
ncbi:TldD/PmbA family protein [Bittarella massiliensis (ex Durand et al. 2017)]|uniref:TldD/PmbA family protein n=1 Tax=Bittarella massiliensis (ex Durand et al. 2017) TaxID=1720313 RepID=UPI001AA13E38|nr:TldD/PmbA family protein [Bittarella massiliensis (ex Durand et al. 2017)]MBO1680619.1 TldD/PmbA family protein [Bittarella massiliensis (ex Durand et al. 2017)]